MLQLPLSEQSPMLITGLTTKWSFAAEWERAAFSYASECSIQLGDDEDGYRVELPLRDFCDYLHRDSDLDDAPLYALDDSFLEEFPSLLRAYTVPEVFCAVAKKQPFAGMEEDEQPPMRWVVLGGARSGSPIHVDPVGAAWNALVFGAKRWVLFPSATSAENEATLSQTLCLETYDGEAEV
ncbi:hypothetical protein CYMTET_34699 [Cymbomonas tetramitiformis]|uniref:JmjC domain-containing protein n=1 Tax=Cymbomonas tetramitiformis TaxID=36881 RepID=A0AAE0FAL5_9CHLO|nr:hypothetical protein CYMTET_34699 [Cymbomonas tetramitiformis]